MQSVEVYTKSGFGKINAKVFIDATGDADLIYQAGDNYVAFNHRFIAVPSSVAVFTSDMDGKAVTWQVTDYDERGCHITLFDEKGEPCEGKIVRAIIRGY